MHTENARSNHCVTVDADSMDVIKKNESVKEMQRAMIHDFFQESSKINVMR